MILSQTPHTLLIPSRLSKQKPPSVVLPPASPGCESMMVYSSSSTPSFFLSLRLSLPLLLTPSLPFSLSLSLTHTHTHSLTHSLSLSLSLSLTRSLSLSLSLPLSLSSSDHSEVSLPLCSSWFLAQTNCPSYCLPQTYTSSLHQGHHLVCLYIITPCMHITCMDY